KFWCASVYGHAHERPATSPATHNTRAHMICAAHVFIACVLQSFPITQQMGTMSLNAHVANYTVDLFDASTNAEVPLSNSVTKWPVTLNVTGMSQPQLND